MATRTTTTKTSTTTATKQKEKEPSEPKQILVLKKKPKKEIKWAEEVIDNEHMGKKKSKCCCIHHKALGPGDLDSDSDPECPDTRSPYEK